MQFSRADTVSVWPRHLELNHKAAKHRSHGEHDRRGAGRGVGGHRALPGRWRQATVFFGWGGCCLEAQTTKLLGLKWHTLGMCTVCPDLRVQASRTSANKQ